MSIFLLCMCLVSGMVFGAKTSALSGSEFEAGNIIDDSVFYDKGRMSADQIQAFLDAKVPVCDTNGTRAYAGTTRAAYGASRGYPTPFVCLKDYKQTTPSIINSGSNLCTGNISSAKKSAAQIIYDVSQACGINPQVLIVLLQKEQSLITDDWPWSIQYRSATGYGCPDTAPCDSEYYGFFNQVYQAAKAYKRYEANPNNYNYKAGRSNYILYNPNASCGGSNVYINNQATANLYIYTPYQPNQSALNNLYGSGDGCGAYGNRNFWRMFNDWFGTTRGSYLLRSTQSATVYLVSGDNKYPISDIATMNALYPLGRVQFVSQQYLSSLQTKPVLKRLIKGDDSTIYFFDAGIKLAFSSCSDIAQYGMSCGEASLLEQVQIDSFSTGPSMPLVMNTTSGKWFYMQDGEKREATSRNALIDNSISSTSVRLHELSLAGLSLGNPIVTDNTILRSRDNSSVYIFSEGKAYQVNSNLINLSFLGLQDGNKLDQTSIDKLTKVNMSGYVTDGVDSYILDNNGKVLVENADDFSDTFKVLPSGAINSMPNSDKAIDDKKFLKSETSSTVYRVEDRKKSPIASWQDLILLDKTPEIISLNDYYVKSLTTTRRQFGPTRLIKSNASATVYMIDGNSKRTVRSFAYTSSMGLGSSVATASNDEILGYPTNSETLGHLISCGGKNYAALNGSIINVGADSQATLGFDNTDFSVFDSDTCRNLKIGSNFSAEFIKSNNSATIYKLENGFKRPINSYARYLSLGGSKANTSELPNSFCSLVATGSSL